MKRNLCHEEKIGWPSNGPIRSISPIRVLRFSRLSLIARSPQRSYSVWRLVRFPSVKVTRLLVTGGR
jgi:hypothetical protein